ncbi:MAG TPA: S8 family serine peptidase [Nocardioidaceae bacterium]
MGRSGPVRGGSVRVTAAVTLLSTLALMPSGASTDAAAATIPPGPLAVPGQGPAAYVVRFSADADVDVRARALRADGVTVERRFRHALKAAVVTATPAQIERVAARPYVVDVAPDDVVTTATGWNLDRVDQRELPLDEAFEPRGGGRGVLVYVVDTGVRSDHDELAGRVLEGFSVLPGGTDDCNGHGTHVAGIALGATLGVAREADVVPVRVLDCLGEGKISDVIAGLDWVVRRHESGTPAVVNLSLVSPGSDILDTAVRGVVDDGVVVVAAAGNADVDACEVSPARVPSALTVAAMTDQDVEVPSSNHGACVDVYAPGAEVLSAWYTSAGATQVLSGTSMAAPHAAGGVAVLLGITPSASPAEVSAELLALATPGVLGGLGPASPDLLLYVGQGPAVTPAEATPLPPTRARDVRARPRSRSAVVRWVRGEPRGAPITGQTVRVIRGGDVVRRVQVPARATRHRVLRLRPGAVYAFRVVEHSRVGSSRPSRLSNRVRPLR